VYKVPIDYTAHCYWSVPSKCLHDFTIGTASTVTAVPSA